ncbi:MAG TPA: TlpA disulfide reductase family protein [Burkholderiales bacterium]|nr:TlpA disulfide reductase family protein [Burkholderiales bacterium]
MRSRIVSFIALSLFTASAWAFNFTDVQGHTQDLASYRGKWVLVNFWATWCPPCLKEIPDLISLQSTYGKTRLAVIGVAMDYRDPKQVVNFARSMHINYPIVLGNSDLAAQVGEIQGLPTSYLFNPSGQIVAYQLGALTKSAVENYINSKNAAKK